MFKILQLLHVQYDKKYELSYVEQILPFSLRNVSSESKFGISSVVKFVLYAGDVWDDTKRLEQIIQY